MCIRWGLLIQVGKGVCNQNLYRNFFIIYASCAAIGQHTFHTRACHDQFKNSAKDSFVSHNLVFRWLEHLWLTWNSEGDLNMYYFLELFFVTTNFTYFGWLNFLVMKKPSKSWLTWVFWADLNFLSEKISFILADLNFLDTKIFFILADLNFLGIKISLNLTWTSLYVKAFHARCVFKDFLEKSRHLLVTCLIFFFAIKIYYLAG